MQGWGTPEVPKPMARTPFVLGFRRFLCALLEARFGGMLKTDRGYSASLLPSAGASSAQL